jgi:hypothetical protein
LPNFPIQRQRTSRACIAASACSLFEHLEIPSVDQSVLDEMVQRGLADGRSGFDALAAAVDTLNLECHVVVARPPKDELEEWIKNHDATRSGFLIAHKVEGGHHITVVFSKDGRWYRADPGTMLTTSVDLVTLDFNYSGDLALVVPSRTAVAILGWGSLVWAPRTLEYLPPWSEDGPELPVEFARISSDGRITLVLMEGVPAVRCYWAISSRSDLETARADLARREGTPARNIGAVARTSKSDDATARIIISWAESKRLAGIVWTALPSNWPEKRSKPYSIDDAVAYLRELRGAASDAAREYVVRAPSQTRTPARVRFESELGWINDKVQG